MLNYQRVPPSSASYQLMFGDKIARMAAPTRSTSTRTSITVVLGLRADVDVLFWKDFFTGVCVMIYIYEQIHMIWYIIYIIIYYMIYILYCVYIYHTYVDIWTSKAPWFQTGFLRWTPPDNMGASITSYRLYEVRRALKARHGGTGRPVFLWFHGENRRGT